MPVKVPSVGDYKKLLFEAEQAGFYIEIPVEASEADKYLEMILNGYTAAGLAIIGDIYITYNYDRGPHIKSLSSPLNEAVFFYTDPKYVLSERDVNTFLAYGVYDNKKSTSWNLRFENPKFKLHKEHLFQDDENNSSFQLQVKNPTYFELRVE